jgi:hypothetical protein
MYGNIIWRRVVPGDGFEPPTRGFSIVIVLSKYLFLNYIIQYVLNKC